MRCRLWHIYSAWLSCTSSNICQVPAPADNGPGCFSGSATQMDDGRQLLMYTSVVAEKQPKGEMRDIQTQSIAIGDGLNYEKPACRIN